MRTIGIQKPFNINLANRTVNAREDNKITWQNSGAQQWERKIEIRLNSDNSLVFELPREQSTSNSFILPEETLVNDNIYRIVITVWDAYENTSSSDPVLFNAHSRPVIELVEFNPTITTNNTLISFSYSVEEPEGNDIRSWNLFIYDSSDALIYSSGVQYTTSLEHFVTNLLNNQTYYVQIQAISAKNMIGLSPKESFQVQYVEQPYDTSIQAQNVENAGIKVSWNVLQITGEGENYSFIDETKLNVLDGKVWFDKGYRIEGDFAIRMMLEQTPNEQFVEADDIKVFKYNETESLVGVGLEDLLVVDPLLSIVAPQELGIVASYVQPSPSLYPADNFLWVQDPFLIGQAARLITIDRNGVSPDTVVGQLSTKMWFAEDYDSEAAIVAIFQEENREITLRRFNNRFVLSFSNTHTTQQFTATGDRFCVIIQRIGGNWSIQGGGYDI